MGTSVTKSPSRCEHACKSNILLNLVQCILPKLDIFNRIVVLDPSGSNNNCEILFLFKTIYETLYVTKYASQLQILLSNTGNLVLFYCPSFGSQTAPKKNKSTQLFLSILTLEVEICLITEIVVYENQT